MKVFLDTSLLSDPKLAELSEELGRRRLAGDEFYVSIITHFQLIWGYVVSGRSTEKYEVFVKRTGIEVIPLTKTDAEEAAGMMPGKKDLLDSLIAASAKRMGANVWTTDMDLLKFLPRERIRLVG